MCIRDSSSLSDAVQLFHPDQDSNTKLDLTTDASDLAVGAVLSQNDNQPLGFFSRKLSEAEKKYSAFDKELLALFLSIKHFRHHLDGRRFTAWTDHKPLCGAMSSSVDRSPRQTRHLSYIAEFTSDVRHVPGASNVVADLLSRPPPSVDSASLANHLDLSALARDQRLDAAQFDHLKRDSSLKIALQDLPGSDPAVRILCDTSQGSPRVLVPESWRRRVFNHFHGLGHTGGRATLRDLRQRFVWFGMSRDILLWARSCPDCLASKVSRHVKSPLQHRPPADHRFSSVHVDLVGPLPSSGGMRYLFTMIDRFTRSLEVVPLSSMTAVDCARALLHHWIARFGVPSDITTDQGRQFTSEVWAELHRVLGIRPLRTTAYHPQANGMIERTHRVLKERLMARNSSSSWIDHLPAVLLSIRSSVREDSGVSPAELVFGSPLRLPGQLLPDPVPLAPPSTDFVADLHRSLRAALPMPVIHHSASSASTRIPSALQSAAFVFVRVDAVRPPLCRPYEGPFKVLEPGPKTFKLEKLGKPWVVSIDRLKAVPSLSAPCSSVPVPLPASPRPRPGLAPLPGSDDDDDDDDSFVPPPPGPVIFPAPLQPAPQHPAHPVPLPGPLPPAPVSPARPVLPVGEYRSRFGRISRPPDRLVL